MTGTEHYDYCTIFLNGMDRSAATELIASLFAAPAEGHTVRIDDTIFYITRNSDAGLAPGFIGWPIKVDVESDQPTPAIVDYAARILTAAWALGYQAVAAADFEEEQLPDQGGRSMHGHP